MKTRILRIRPVLPAILLLLIHYLVAVARPIPDEIRASYAGISAERIEAHLTFLASDELEGRGAGTRGSKTTSRYLMTQFLLDGLIPPPGWTSMLQPFDFTRLRYESSSRLIVNAVQDERVFDIYDSFFVISKQDKPPEFNAPVVFARFGLRDQAMGIDDYEGIDANGKIVLVYDSDYGEVNPEGPIHGRALRNLRKQKAETAARLGARAILFYNPYADISFNRRTLSKVYKKPRYKLTGTANKPVQAIVSEEIFISMLEAAGWNLDSLDALMSNSDALLPTFELPAGTLLLNLDIASDTLQTQNVVAYLEGSDPDLKHEVMLYSAHFDHEGIRDGIIYHGADDNGSGTAAMLEIAHAFAQNPVRPRRSVAFIAHAAEEKGLLGSDYASRNLPFDLKDVQALLNIDMIGRNKENQVYIIGSNFLSYELHDINASANQIIGMDFDYRYNSLSDLNRFYFRSDHYNYARFDIPIIFYFTGTHEDYHKPGDTADKINYRKIQKICRLVYLTGWQLASIDNRLQLNGLLKQD